MIQSSYIKTILNYFKSLNIDDLRHHLKDEHTYEDTTKEIFLDEIEKVFVAHKNSGDTELIIYPGKCVSKTCPNCGKKGYSFVGNISKNYMDLLFDIEDDVIKDIFECVDLKTDVEIEDLGVKADIYINLDDQNSFIKTPEYMAKVNAANAAWAEIITTPPRQLNFEELSLWIDKYSCTNELIGKVDPFESPMKWTPFSLIYNDLKEIRDYISDHISEIRVANSEIAYIQTEQDLIDWLLRYEDIGDGAPFNFKYSFKKDGDYFKWNYQNPIHFKDDVFVESQRFLEYFNVQYQDILNKYTTYTSEEASILYNMCGSLEETKDLYSLRFHMKNRQAMEDAGIHIPLYINRGISEN